MLSFSTKQAAAFILRKSSVLIAPTRKMGYKLHYFDVRYYAEPARMMFHAAGVDFEDITFTKDEWDSGVKKTAPTGKAPWLQVDGHVITESWAINRFLAKRFGFNGQDEFEEALIDSTAHFMRNYMPDVYEYLLIAGGRVQGDREKCYKEKTGPALDAIFGYIHKYVSESDSGFIVKSGPTWIDLVIAEQVIRWGLIVTSFKENYPQAVEFQKRVHSHPKFKEFADKRKSYPSCYLSRKRV